MKLTRASYPGIFAFLIFSNIRLTIEQFSEELAEQIFIPTLIIFIILIIISIILSIKDGEFVHIISDERTKKVDRAAGYYSWWFTVIFAFIFGLIVYIKNLTVRQYIFVLITEMFLTMFIFHMYFNFKGD